MSRYWGLMRLLRRCDRHPQPSLSLRGWWLAAARSSDPAPCTPGGARRQDVEDWSTDPKEAVQGHAGLGNFPRAVGV